VVGAWRFVATFGVISLLADIVYEGARSITGPLLASLGATAVSDYEVINHELAAYNPQLAARAQFVVATKIDALDEPERLEKLRQRARADDRPFFAVSAVTGAGVRELLTAIARELEQLRGDLTAAQSTQRGDSLLVGGGPARF